MSKLRIVDSGYKYHKVGDQEVLFFQHDWTDPDTSPIYIGWVTVEGVWLIEKIDTTNKTRRYAMGQDNYTTNWTNRASLSYDTIDNWF